MRNRRFWTLLIVIQFLTLNWQGAFFQATYSAPTCVQELEPNDTPEAATAFDGEGCFEGTTPEDDQDLWLWTVPGDGLRSRWTFTFDGIGGTVSGLKVFAVTSETGAVPVVPGSQLFEVASQPDTSQSVTIADIWLPPGIYILGVSRSGMADGSTPQNTSYSFSVSEGDSLPDDGDIEPNDDTSTATPLLPTFEVSGDGSESNDYYSWALDDESSTKGWALHAQTFAGSSMTIDLLFEDGQTLASYSADPRGIVDAHDFKLEAGRYFIEVRAQSDPPHPYLLKMSEADAPDSDLEPNDVSIAASPIDPEHPVVRGRLDHEGDHDYYQLTVDDTLANTLFDLKLIWKSSLSRTLCLHDENDAELQCRSAAEGVSLSNVLLPAGVYFLEISGDAGLDDFYLLRLDATASPSGEFETEPNDAVSYATTMSLEKSMKGRLDGSEDDFLRVLISGDPQLWELDVNGSGIDKVSVVAASGTELMLAEVENDRTSATLSDLYLVPGEHWFRIAGSDGTYSISLKPLGPPDPNAEREPNNDAVFAEALAIGKSRLGRIVESTDSDVYRFSLAAQEHIAITLQPPADGALVWRLESSGTVIATVRSPVIGEVITYDAELLPGGYEIWVTASTPSSGNYDLKIDRLDPFVLSDDQEPNDNAAQARPIPASLTVSGTAGNFGDDDWYSLPVAETLTSLTIVTEGVYSIGLSDGLNDFPLTPDVDGTTYTSDRLPAGIPLLLRVTTLGGPYTISVEYADGPQRDPREAKLSLSMQLDAETDRVAAYWPAGQRVSATLTLTNGGLLSQNIHLDAVTSHYAWSIEIDQPDVKIGRASSIEVPLTILALPDAWADVPVRITVRATNAAGGIVTGFLEITPDRDVAPVNPEQAWSVPDELLGGLDVASLGLGATVVPTVDQIREEALHDGVTPAGGGFFTSGVTLPIELTVDLAGEESVPVSGIILNPQAADSVLSDTVRGFNLLLSEDGVEYQVALSGEISPLPIDQPFVLPAPVLARFAKLEITSTHAATPYGLALGEWKVIATPGFVPTDASLNLGALALGGHTVWMEPQSYDIAFPEQLLTADGIRQVISAAPSSEPQWVVGFLHDRAAQLVELQWIDPPGSDPETRFNTVVIEISQTSPLGPWERVGSWELERSDDGSVSPFEFDEPTWARFVRFTGDGAGDETRDLEYPDEIQLIERSTDDDYRSIVAEWGQNSQSGPFERLNPPDFTAIDEGPDDNDAPETATPLVPGEDVKGRVHIGEDEDWYAITAPEGNNTLKLTVTGNAWVGVKLTLVDDAGLEVPMSFDPVKSETATAIYSATVIQGQTYNLLVEQPPHSVAISFDTSTSLSNYAPYVNQALRSFATAIVPGQEFVNIVPFESDPLLDHWSDLPYEIQSAINSYVDQTLSSSAETALIDSSKLLANQEGARAILVVTDAETSSFQRSAELWSTLGTVRPIIFSVHIGGNTAPMQSQHFMEDWSAAGGGFYQYTRSHGEMDRAFDRLATWLRRPVDYGLSYEATTEDVKTATPEPTSTPQPTSTPEATQTPEPTETPEAEPTKVRQGGLQVVAANDDGNQSGATAGSSVAIEIILDTSGSMLADLGTGQTRIDVAKEVLIDLVTSTIPDGAPVALRVFGSEPGSCETTLASPLQPLDGDALAGQIQDLVVVNLVKTLLGFALEQVANDLADVDGPKVVILVTDGEETCEGDPAAAIQSLIDQGIDVQVNIVGFALDDEALKDTFREWARLGNGNYYDATNADELEKAIAKAASAPYRVYDADGNVVASGTVGGSSVRLDPGTYTVVVLTDPEIRIEEVEVESGKKTKVTAGDD